MTLGSKYKKIYTLILKCDCIKCNMYDFKTSSFLAAIQPASE